MGRLFLLIDLDFLLGSHVVEPRLDIRQEGGTAGRQRSHRLTDLQNGCLSVGIQTDLPQGVVPVAHVEAVALGVHHHVILLEVLRHPLEFAAFFYREEGACRLRQAIDVPTEEDAGHFPLLCDVGFTLVSAQVLVRRLGGFYGRVVIWHGIFAPLFDFAEVPRRFRHLFYPEHPGQGAWVSKSGNSLQNNCI